MDYVGVRTQKYIKKFSNYSTTEVTWLDKNVEPKCKYSKYIEDLVIAILSIEEMSYEKVSEIIKLTTSVDISSERVCEIFLEKKLDGKSMKTLKKSKRILEQIIQLSGVIHYDEQIVIC